MSNYVGLTPEILLESLSARFFYGLRRSDEGELFLGKNDQFKNDEGIQINLPGNDEDNLRNYREGQDFFEGRNVYHDLIYLNLIYEQFRWDSKDIYYYVNEEGELVARINQSYEYDDSVSSAGK